MNNQIDDRTLEELVRQVVQEIRAEKGTSSSTAGISYGDNAVFNSIDDAVAAARQAFLRWRQTRLETRRTVIEALRQVGRDYAFPLAEMAHTETKLGRTEDKVNKNKLVSEKTPGIEILTTAAQSGDHGLTVIERAPFGVIGAITPTTNPTSTIINNTISALAGGNTVVYNVHPRSKETSLYTVQLLNKTIQSAGGPPNLLTTIREPTIESAQQLMDHKDIDLLLITGGPAVVEVAMKAGKRAVCAGPGNPPVVVDETAVIDKAGRDIINGCSFDNNLVCCLEKEVFVVEAVADRLKAAMCANGAFEVPPDGISRLENVIFSEIGSPGTHGKINPEWIGQNASDILRTAGFNVDDNIRVALLDVPADHSLIYTEQMMPVLPMARVNHVDEGIDLALHAEHGFKHTAVMHSLNLRALSRMAGMINTTIFVKNAPSYSGLGFEGEGYTSFSIGTTTGEGLTTALTFTRERRCALVDYFRIV